MGLDISGYSNIKMLECETDEDGEPIGLSYGEYCRLYINSDYPQRADNIVNGNYSFDDEVDFRAGSYSGYNAWRSQLATLAGFKDANEAWDSEGKDYPFRDLINFSDCEGVIGPDTCKKLLTDFIAHDEKAKELGDYFYEQYQKWTKAMDLGSNNGAVQFY